MNSKAVTIIALLALSASQSFADAGLTGKRYLTFGGGVIDPGNEIISAIDDSIVTAGAELNIPVSTHIDFKFNYTHEHMEGELLLDTYKARGDNLLARVRYLFNPDNKVNPFMGAGLGYYKSEAEINGNEVADADGHIYLMEGGVEIELTQQLSITPVIAYGESSDEEDVTAGVQLNVWFSQEIFASVGASFGFDEEDAGLTGQIGFTF